MGFFEKVKKAFDSGEKEDGKSQDRDENIGNDETSEKIKNFIYLDDLIHSSVKEIVLDSDIVLGGDEESQYLNGIKLDVDDLAIDGNGHTIDARGLTRIFYCTGKNVIIKNIILKKGFAEKDGGAIYNDEGELTISESTLTANTSQESGGAIDNIGGELTITGSSFTENTSKFGGAIHNRGVLTISESTFTGNFAKGSGGAINNTEEGVLTISESTLTENTAKWVGGAINNDKGELTISESILIGNTAQTEYNGGGAIYLTNTTKKYESDNCTFKDNKPDDIYKR